MSDFRLFLKSKKPIIGMIHLAALPGTPKNNQNPQEIIERAVNEAKLYQQAGIETVMIENMHDLPYLKGHIGHEISSLMAIIGYEIKRQTDLFCGIQVLAAANIEALAVANSANLDFIRAEAFVFGHLADEGMLESTAAELLRYRKLISAENVMIFTDIKKKHSSHAISIDTSISEHAQAAEFFLADGVIVTGKSTGLKANLDELIEIKKDCNLPILIGSGLTSKNVTEYYSLADGFIIGSYFKEDGNWQNPPKKERIEALLKQIPK